MNQFIQGVDTLSEWLGKILSWFCVLMMITTCLVVVMRYLFNAGNIIFVQETVMYLHGATFLLASGWTLKHQGHVRVDVFYRRFSRINQAWVDSIGILLFLLPICGFLFFASLDFVALSWSIKETSGEAGGISYVYLQKTMILGLSITLGLQGLAELVRNAILLSETVVKGEGV